MRGSYRTGGQQKVTVEHVTVNQGGQAIVGNVSHPGGGSNAKSEDQPHAPKPRSIGHAPGTTMPSDIEAERQAVPVAGLVAGAMSMAGPLVGFRTLQKGITARAGASWLWLWRRRSLCSCESRDVRCRKRTQKQAFVSVTATSDIDPSATSALTG